VRKAAVEFEKRLERYRFLIDTAMRKYFENIEPFAPALKDAMVYAAIGGKRLRGATVLAVHEELGGNVEDAIGLSIAMEMVHAYSLVHDDLPCMDNDDTRRGKPTCHRKYGEALALLCGDALLTAAFEAAASSGNLPDSRRLRAIQILANAAGAAGMVAGQVLDLGLDGDLADAGSVARMYRLKTGKLFEASARMGAVAAGAPDDIIEAAGSWGLYFGYAFQIVDDLDDMEAEEEKTTLARVTSCKEAGEEAEKSLRASLEALSPFSAKPSFLESLSSRYLDLLSGQNLQKSSV